MGFLDKIGATKSAPKIFIRVLLYGGPSTGKSTMALSFPRPFVADLERGSSALRSVGAFNKFTGEPLSGVAQPGKYPVKEYFDVADFMSDVHAMSSAGVFKTDAEFGTFVVDTISKIVDMIDIDYEEYKSRFKKNQSTALFSSSGKQSFADFASKKRPINQLMSYINEAKLHVVFIAHEGIKMREEIYVDRSGNEKTKAVVSGTKAKGITGHDFDIVLHFLDQGHIEYQKHRPLVVLAEVEKDRFGVFREGQIIENPHYDMWKEAIENPSQYRKQRLSSLENNKTQTSLQNRIDFALQNQLIRSTMNEYGINEDVMRRTLAKYNVDIDLVISKIKEKVKNEI